MYPNHGSQRPPRVDPAFSIFTNDVTSSGRAAQELQRRLGSGQRVDIDGVVRDLWAHLPPPQRREYEAKARDSHPLPLQHSQYASSGGQHAQAPMSRFEKAQARNTAEPGQTGFERFAREAVHWPEFIRQEQTHPQHGSLNGAMIRQQLLHNHWAALSPAEKHRWENEARSQSSRSTPSLTTSSYGTDSSSSSPVSFVQAKGQLPSMKEAANRSVEDLMRENARLTVDALQVKGRSNNPLAQDRTFRSGNVPR